jgi:hypothetical protein
MEETKDISQIVMQKIKETGIKPISRNVFSFKRVLFWSLVGVSLIFGALSFSVVLSILFNNDWYLYNKLGFGFILKTLPYFWVVFLVIFMILGEFYYRKTLLGYRYRIITIVGIYVIITVISGSALNAIGVGENIEQSLFENIPVYHAVVFDRNEIWTHPEQGLLTGKIINIGEKSIQVMDKKGVVWNININAAFLNNKMRFVVGKTIKIVGDIDNDIDNLFNADEIHITKK